MIGIELEEAIELLIERTKEIKEIEELEILDSLGYILAEDVTSEIKNPPFNKSPLDGFALNNIVTKEASQNKPVVLKVEKEIIAGDFFEKISSDFVGVRIMTGAPIPLGCNAVIKQEEVIYDEETRDLTIFRELNKYENFCFAGEDFEIGDILLRAGEKITVNHIGVLASLGKANIKVIRKPTVGLLCTGDEIILPGKELGLGKIYNSNLFSLASRLKRIGVDVKLYSPMGDNASSVADFIRGEMPSVDLMITTGGVSVGKKDIFHDVIKEIPSERLFWKVNMKPGTPVMASIYNETLILSLSGNPFASIVNYELLAIPILNKLSRGMVENNIVITGLLEEDFGKISKTRRFIRARYEDGKVYFNTTKHSSGQLSSTIGKNALIDIGSGSDKLQKGDRVEVLIVGE